MLDISKVLSRSWHILWKYRILWIFGFFLAMGAGGSSPNFTGSYQMNKNDFRMGHPWFQGSNFPHWLGETPEQIITMLITVGIVLLVVILFWAVISAFLRYVSEVTTIRAVNEYEATGVMRGFKQLWKNGWNRTAWHLFLINLLISLPFIAMILIFGLLGLWVYLAATGGSEGFLIFSSITVAGLALLLILFFFLLGIALGVIRNFAARICVLEGAGVIDSIKQGYAMVRRHLKQVFFMWLVMVGIGIAWAIASLFMILPLLLVVLLTILPGVIAGAIPGLLATGLAALFTPSPWYWIIGAIVALPLFFLITFSPMILVGGWQQIFNTSVWTETYRELKALEVVKSKSTLPVGVPKPARKVVKTAAVKPVVKKTTTAPAVKPRSLPKK
jgi:hypothetical protein